MEILWLSQGEHISLLEKSAEEMKVYFWFWFGQPSALRFVGHLYFRDTKVILFIINNR